VFISKGSLSDDIEILAPDKNYTALYDVSNQKFSDIVVLFSVRSPLIAADNYSVSLNESVHYCDAELFSVQLSLDGSAINKGETVSALDFTYSDADNKWRNHQLSLVFPEIERDVSEVSCSGLVGITVELGV
jgi:hypothetical protein